MKPVIAWWSGGVTSAVTCNLCIELFGRENVRIVFIDTRNEDEDTYRFKNDCEIWYGVEIETITSEGYENITEVWLKHKSLNVAKGAICSSELKRKVREKWQKDNEYSFQAFGFDITEFTRVRSMFLNNPNVNPIFPLLLFGYDKKDCIKIITDLGIEIPRMYKLGFKNNNCFKTGCVQGGIGYWKKIQEEYPEKFLAMALLEHLLTDLKGKPVTMLRIERGKKKYPLFLTKHKDYPDIKCIDEVKGRPVEPVFECNGFCGINDLSKRNKTENEINYED